MPPGLAAFGEGIGERLHQEAIDILGEEKTDDEGQKERDQRFDQTRAQLHQMLEQRRFARLEFGFFFR